MTSDLQISPNRGGDHFSQIPDCTGSSRRALFAAQALCRAQSGPWGEAVNKKDTVVCAFQELTAQCGHHGGGQYSKQPSMW